MGLEIVLLSLLILLIFFIVIKEIKRIKNLQTANDITNGSLLAKERKDSFKSNGHVMPGIATTIEAPASIWWNELGTLSQLHLALMLIQKALPVWNKYTGANNAVYKDSPAMPFNKIDKKLLQISFDEITASSLLSLPDCNNKIIYQCYFNFVGPVIALQDGTWLPPYPVKKLFLAVYNILKCIIEQKSSSGTAHLLAIAINQALDCMYMSRLYSSEEIVSFLAVCKNKLQPEML